MDSTKRIFKFQNYDWIKSVGSFWCVIILVNIFAIISDNGFLSIAGSNMMIIFIFFLAYGIAMYHENFALAISFGATRRDFYKSAIVSNLLMCLIFAGIQGYISG